MRCVVLASGGGSLLHALSEEAKKPEYPATIVAVGSDRSSAGALSIARDAHIPTFAVRLREFATRAEWDAALTQQTLRYAPDLVISAGFMKLVGTEFLHHFEGRLINTHPSLLPAFPGAHAVRDAVEYGVRVTGCSVFYVDKGVDTGRIIEQRPVRVQRNDTHETLHERIKVVEREMLIDVVRDIAAHS